jgi:hypothetical protein
VTLPGNSPVGSTFADLLIELLEASLANSSCRNWS